MLFLTYVKQVNELHNDRIRESSSSRINSSRKTRKSQSNDDDSSSSRASEDKNPTINDLICENSSRTIDELATAFEDIPLSLVGFPANLFFSLFYDQENLELNDTIPVYKLESPIAEKSFSVGMSAGTAM